MAFEILIEESDAGFGSAIEEFEGESTVTEFETPADFETAILSMLEEFRGKYEQEFDPSQLDFFVPNIDRDHYEEPWKILEEIRQNEVKVDNEKRETLRQVAEEGLEKPEEEKLEELPEGMEYEEYKDYWLEYGLDAAIDTPYFTRDNMHPELRKLYEEVRARVLVELSRCETTSPPFREIQSSERIS
ncbi:MAG: hypothetical protein U5K28_00980 [Halobacteriales archaeon]|nr:hypothetical protein [Halobacteriales archaeon]